MKISTACAASLLSLGLVGAASAADYSPAPPPQPTVYYTPQWGGLYVGGHTGYGWGDRSGTWCIDDPEDCAVGDIPDFFGGYFDYEQEGWLIGAQLGYDHMITDHVLLGLEVSGSFAGIDGDGDVYDYNDDFVNTGKGEYDWVSTFTGRAGYAWDNVLLYGELGVGLAGFDWQSLNGCNFSQVRDGVVYGGGGEVKVSERASLQLEYNHFDFDDDNAFCTSSGVFPTLINTEADLDVIKFGFNYQLGGM